MGVYKQLSHIRCHGTVGVDRKTIRKYIQNQELKERQPEQQDLDY